MSFESDALAFEEEVAALMKKYPTVAYVMVATPVNVESGPQPVAVVGNVKREAASSLLYMGHQTVQNSDITNVFDKGKAN